MDTSINTSQRDSSKCDSNEHDEIFQASLPHAQILYNSILDGEPMHGHVKDNFYVFRDCQKRNFLCITLSKNPRYVVPAYVICVMGKQDISSSTKWEKSFIKRKDFKNEVRFFKKAYYQALTCAEDWDFFTNNITQISFIDYTKKVFCTKGCGENIFLFQRFIQSPMLVLPSTKILIFYHYIRLLLFCCKIGLVTNDFHYGNVVLNEDGFFTFCDFGLLKKLKRRSCLAHYPMTKEMRDYIFSSWGSAGSNMLYLCFARLEEDSADAEKELTMDISYMMQAIKGNNKLSLYDIYVDTLVMLDDFSITKNIDISFFL